jgi:hypothetical protein
MTQTINETEQGLPENLDRWSQLDFEESTGQKETPHANLPHPLPQEITEQSPDPELEPILFDDDDSVHIEVTDRPFQKKPLPKIMLGLIGAGLGAVAVGTFITAGSNDASKVFAENSSLAPDGTVASNIPGKDPRDQKIGELQSDQATSTLKAKIDALNKRKELEAKQRANKDRGTKIASAPTTVTPTYASLPVASAPDPVPFRSVPDSQPYTQLERTTPVSQNYEPQRVQQPQQPVQQPKLLAFGGMPEDRGGSTSTAAQPVSGTAQGSAQSTGYTQVAYRPESQGFDTQETSLEDQQRAFLGGDRQARISANASASGTVSSGAILPGRFSVQIDSPLSGIPAGTIIIFETKTVYPSGNVEAYGIGVTSGDYQRLRPIPVGAIALFSNNGNRLKAQRPSAGFLSSPIGRALFGAVQGAAGRYLSTDSVLSQSNSGTLLSQSAGGKGFSDLAAGALQGGLSPLLQSLPQQQQGATDDKSFSVEPGKKVMVKVLQPFTFSL